MSNSFESFLMAVKGGRSFQDPTLSLVDCSPLEDEGIIGFALDYVPFDLSRIWFAVAAKQNRCWICREEMTFRRKEDIESWDAIWDGDVEIPSFVFAQLQRDVCRLWLKAKGCSSLDGHMVDADWYVFKAKWSESSQIEHLALWMPGFDDSKSARRITSRIEKLIQRPRRYFERLSIPLVGRILWWLS